LVVHGCGELSSTFWGEEPGDLLLLLLLMWAPRRLVH
jgi:hypothetical protein